MQGLMEEFQRRHDNQGTALELVQMVTETFPSFRDETWLEGQRGTIPTYYVVKAPNVLSMPKCVSGNVPKS